MFTVHWIDSWGPGELRIATVWEISEWARTNNRVLGTPQLHVATYEVRYVSGEPIPEFVLKAIQKEDSETLFRDRQLEAHKALGLEGVPVVELYDGATQAALLKTLSNLEKNMTTKIEIEIEATLKSVQTLKEAKDLLTRLLALPEAASQLAYLDRGISTATEQNVWREARDFLAITKEEPKLGWLEAATAWEVCASIHGKYAKGKDALYSTRHADFVSHALKCRSVFSGELDETKRP